MQDVWGSRLEVSTAVSALYKRLENALDYEGHSEVCGCPNAEHARLWAITVTLLEDDVRELLDLLRQRATR